MSLSLSRRQFLSASAGLIASTGVASFAPSLLAADAPNGKALPFQISLAQWSLHRTFFDKKADPLDFAKIA